MHPNVLSRQPWRLLPFLIAEGSRQMAIDGAIFRAVSQGISLPTLRFYQWKPTAISLGYHQHNYPNHWQGLTFENQAIDLVRRPTGGRAVLHQGDLTYGIILSGLPNSRVDSYRTICDFLIQGWRSLSYELSYGSAGRGYIHNPNCFGTATEADLVLPGGQKLIGSAQKRSADTVLQHGSMRLTPDLDLFERVFGTRAKVENPHPPMPSIEQIIPAMITAAEICFGAKFTIGSLSPQEEDWIEQLLPKK